MAKGGGGSQTVQQNADPWSGAQPYIRQGLDALQQTFQHGTPGSGSVNIGGTQIDRGVTPPTYYPNSTVASMSPWTTGALGAQYQRGAYGSPVTNAAQGQAWSTLNGDGFNNPALTSAINYATAPVEAAVNSAFSSAGRYGSGSHENELARSIGDISSNMAYQNYNNERNRQMQTMAFAPSLAQNDYFDINQAGAAGSALDAYNQAQINADVERFNYGQDADWRRIQDFLATVQGVAPTGSQSVSRTTPNAFSTALGTGLGTAGILNMLGLFGGGGAGAGATLGALGAGLLSDERVKENIEPVGMLHNGLNVYSYNYIGDPTTQIGLLAQEVEQVHPEAVGRIGPFKTVRYDLATEAA